MADIVEKMVAKKERTTAKANAMRNDWFPVAPHFKPMSVMETFTRRTIVPNTRIRKMLK